MTMLAGRILYAVHKGTCIIKLIGEVRVPLCAALDSFIERMFDDGGIQGVLVDLNQSTAIDSTTLGLVAKVAVRLREKLGRRPVILSSNPDITRLLQSMGFDQVFVIVEQSNAEPLKLDELPSVECSQEEMLRNVIEAHRLLMNLNAENAATFKDLVDALECEQRATSHHA